MERFRKFRIGIEVVFDTVAEKKFVPEHILRTVENRLAGNEALSRQRERVRCRGFLCGRSGFHTSYIGIAVAELQAKLRGCRLPETKGFANRRLRLHPTTMHASGLVQGENVGLGFQGNVLDVENLGHFPLAQSAVS